MKKRALLAWSVLLAPSADPLKDIRNTEAIWRVIKGGRLFDPEKLGTRAANGPNGESNGSLTLF